MTDRRVLDSREWGAFLRFGRRQPEQQEGIKLKVRHNGVLEARDRPVWHGPRDPAPSFSGVPDLRKSAHDGITPHIILHNPNRPVNRRHTFLNIPSSFFHPSSFFQDSLFRAACSSPGCEPQNDPSSFFQDSLFRAASAPGCEPPLSRDSIKLLGGNNAQQSEPVTTVGSEVASVTGEVASSTEDAHAFGHQSTTAPEGVAGVQQTTNSVPSTDHQQHPDQHGAGGRGSELGSTTTAIMDQGANHGTLTTNNSQGMMKQQLPATVTAML